MRAKETIFKFDRLDAFEQEANVALRILTDGLDPRCFVLDGRTGAAVLELRQQSHQVLTPNIDRKVVEKLTGTLSRRSRPKKKESCAEARQQTLTSNLKRYDGFADARRVVGLAHEPTTNPRVSPSGTVLAVTIAEDDSSEFAAQRTRLDNLLLKGCQRAQMRLACLGIGTPDDRNITTLFYGIGRADSHLQENFMDKADFSGTRPRCGLI